MMQSHDLLSMLSCVRLSLCFSRHLSQSSSFIIGNQHFDINLRRSLTCLYRLFHDYARLILQPQHLDTDVSPCNSVWIKRGNATFRKRADQDYATTQHTAHWSRWAEKSNIIVLGGLVFSLTWEDIQSNVPHNGMACSEIMRGQIGDFKINDHISIIMQRCGLLVTPARAIIHHSPESYLHHLMCINILNIEIVNFSIRMTCLQTLWKT